jgi:tripartite-type tricarboxylate transporter receptor subunit TctC
MHTQAHGFAVMVLLLALTPITQAEAQNFPGSKMSIVVPVAPGGGTDLLGRVVAERLEKKWHNTIVVENKPGAGTIIGAQTVAKAPPDGNTLLIATSTTLAINPAIYKALPYDPVADFKPVAIIASVPFLLVVNPSLPVHSVQELVDYAKSNPGKLTFGSNGAGSPHHLFAELFQSMTGTKMTHVPYRGSMPAVTDLLSGQIQVLFVDFAPALPQVKVGKLRALGVTSAQRVWIVPEVPTIAEAGVPDYDASAWQALVAPGKTPDDVVAKISGAMREVLGEAEVKNRISSAAMVPLDGSSPDKLKSFVRSELDAWAAVVNRAGIAGSQ